MYISNKNKDSKRNNLKLDNIEGNYKDIGFSNKTENVIPLYKLAKPSFSKEELVLLEELRGGLVDLVISSGNNFQINELNELNLLDDIKNFLRDRFLKNKDLNEKYGYNDSYNEVYNNIYNDNGFEKDYSDTNHDSIKDSNYNINHEGNHDINPDIEYENDHQNNHQNNHEDNYEGNYEHIPNDYNDFNNFNNLNNYNSNFDIDIYNKNENNIDKLAKRLFEGIFGYGEIDPLIRDDCLEEIMINGINKPVFVYHREYGMMESNLVFKTNDEIISIIDAIARQINRRIDQESPLLDARLVDGSRVNATIPPISADGPSVTIRKFKKDPLSIVDIINQNTLNCDLAAFLWLCVDGLGVKPANAIISGGTSSGKTTTLNALSAFINPRERIITIEDTLELQIPHKHILRMETRPPNIENKGELSMDDLVKNSLRQRPDRIILGEVRGKEAITLFTALNTGHSGFGTLHSNSSRETITRLTNSPMSVHNIMISAIDFIIMQNRIYGSDGISLRRITEVVEVVGMEEETIQLNKIFQWNSKTDTIENVSISSKTLQTIADFKGIKIKDLHDEITDRKKILEFLVQNNIRDLKNLGSMIENYYLNPESTLESILDVDNQ